MKPINFIRLEHSHHNLIIQKVADNGVVTVSEVDWNDFIAGHSAELYGRITELNLQIEELRRSREQTEELACYKLQELQHSIADLEEQLAERENRFMEIAIQLSECSLTELTSGYKRALDAFLDGHIDEALELLDENRLKEIECQQAQQRILRGNILYFQNRLQEAEYNMRRAVEVTPTLENFITLGLFYSNIRCYGQACAVYRCALPYCSDDFERARIFSSIGGAHLKMKNLRAAKRYINKGYAVLVGYLSGQYRLLPLIHCLEISCARAYLALELRDYETAEEVFHHTLTLLNEDQGAEITDFKAWTFSNYARMLEETGRIEEALEMYTRTISLYEVLASERPELNKPYLAQALLKYANLLFRNDKEDLRETYYLRAYELTHDMSIPHFWHKTLTAEVLVALCLLYEGTPRAWMLQTHLVEARMLLEEIYEENPDLYLPKLCYILEKQCVFFEGDLQLESIRRGIEVYEKMSIELQKEWFMLGAWFNFRMALRQEIVTPDEAERYYSRALELARRAVIKHPEKQEELAYMEQCAVRYMLGKMSGIEVDR